MAEAIDDVCAPAGGEEVASLGYEVSDDHPGWLSKMHMLQLTTRR